MACGDDYRSDDDEEWSLLLELGLLVDDDNLLELSVVGEFSPEVVEVEGLSDLIPELSVDGHGLDLSRGVGTWRVMVAPDSRSPNLQKPVVMCVSLLKKRKNLFLNSGNFFSQGKPLSYSRSQSSRWMVSGLKSAPSSGFWWMISLRCTSLTSGSRVRSLSLVQKSIQGRMVSPLKPTARSQNWQKKSESEGRTKIWKGSWYRSLRKQMVLRAGKTRQMASCQQEQKGGLTAGESSGFLTLVGSSPSRRQVQQAGLHLYCQRTLQGLPVVQLTLLKRIERSSDTPD